MNILEAIKKDLDKRRNELAEQEALNRRTGKFIDAAIYAARESEARFSLNLIRDYLAFGKSFGFEPVKTSAAAPDVPVEWRVADKDSDKNIVLRVGEMAFFCDHAKKGDEYIPLPAGVEIPSGENGLPRWEKLEVDCGLPHCFIVGEDGTTTYVAYKGHRINLDEIFDKLPKRD